MSKKEREELNKDMQSVPMVIIMKLKKQLNWLLILNLILTMGFVISVYDSIKVRDDYWKGHTQDIINTIHQHCESERDAAWQG